MKYIKTFNEVSRQTKKDMESFSYGLSSDIDSDGYVTLYHGGKKLPEEIMPDQIFFMTPDIELARDYAKMRKGIVHKLKVNPDDVHWNRGSYEVEFKNSGYIKDGVLITKKKTKIKKGSSSENDPWSSTSKKDYRFLSKYKNISVGDKLKKSDFEIMQIIQHKNGLVQFKSENDKWFNADNIVDYENTSEKFFESVNGNHDYTTKKDKIDFTKHQLVINNGNKIKKGTNRIYLDGIEVGGFNIVSEIGGEIIDDNKNVYDNSIFLKGGFIINKDYKYKGIGKETIKTIFEKSNIDNIFLYAVDWQGAVDFWKKIGGEVIFRDEEKELNLIRIQNKNKINI
jgi:predicted acetyltransferase